MAFTEIIYRVENHVARITFNRPERMNALTMTPHEELAGAVTEASRDDEVCVLVPTGAGRGFVRGR